MVTWRSSGRLSRAYTGAEADLSAIFNEFLDPDPGPALLRHRWAHFDGHVSALIVRPVVADLLAAGAERRNRHHDPQRHVILPAIATDGKGALTAHLRSGAADRRSFVDEMREGQFHVGVLRIEPPLELVENRGQAAKGNFPRVLGQDFEESAHVGALEVMGEVDRHRNVSHGGHWLAAAALHADRVAEIGNADLINGDAAGIRGALYVFHAFLTAESATPNNTPPTTKLFPKLSPIPV